MIDRVIDSMFHWYRLVGGASDGARVLDPDGVVAAVVPAAPERAVVNAVLFRRAKQLEAAYDEIAAAYREIGAKWTVWVPPGDEGDAAARLLKERGHVLDAQPMAMLHDLDGTTRPTQDELPEWSRGGDVAAVAAINDRSYTFGTDSFSRALTRLPDEVHIYLAGDGGKPVGCLVVTDVEGTSEIDLVAVLPEARGRGITSRLLRHALADAAERGNESATLVATPMGMPVYERAGFAPLGRIAMWERSPAPR